MKKLQVFGHRKTSLAETKRSRRAECSRRDRLACVFAFGGKTATTHPDPAYIEGFEQLEETTRR